LKVIASGMNLRKRIISIACNGKEQDLKKSVQKHFDLMLSEGTGKWDLETFFELQDCFDGALGSPNEVGMCRNHSYTFTANS
jgi:hypothetical protein